MFETILLVSLKSKEVLYAPRLHAYSSTSATSVKVNLHSKVVGDRLKFAYPLCLRQFSLRSCSSVGESALLLTGKTLVQVQPGTQQSCAT